jgi:hypothetical protein
MTSIWSSRFGYVFIGCVFMALAGCTDTPPAQTAKPVRETVDVQTYGPDENGVACYWRYGGTLSCVKVR